MGKNMPQEKNTSERYHTQSPFIMIFTEILPKKTTLRDTPDENSLDFHLTMIKKIDTLLKEHDLITPADETSETTPPISPPPTPIPIEPRPPLHKTLNHGEITWGPIIQQPFIQTRTIPEEFKTELSFHPEFKFITSNEFTDTILQIKPRPEERVEIIDVSTLITDESSAQKTTTLTISKHRISEKQANPTTKKEQKTSTQTQQNMEVIDARTLKQKTYEDVFFTALKQSEEIEKKSQIYYLNSKNHDDKKQKKLEFKQTYIPVDFEQRSKELKEKQHQEEEDKKQEEEKIQKQLEKEHEKLEKLTNKKTKLEEKKHEQQHKEKKEPKKEPPHSTIEIDIKKHAKEEKRVDRLEKRKIRLEQRKQQREEKKTLKEQKKQQHLTQKTKEKPTKEKNTSFSLFKKEKTTQTQELDEDLIKVLLITDNLLGELPQDVIDKFAQSEDFELYERVLNKYKIK